MDKQEAALDQLVRAVQDSPRYQNIDPHFIRRVGARELAKRRRLREAIKATKSKLHQVAGAYLATRPRYEVWLEALRAAAQQGDEEALRRTCIEIMRHHASTRERLPILDRFYATTMAPLAPVDSVLDIACGFNPLAIPWMPLAKGATYYACDLYQDMMAFLEEFMKLVPVQGRAVTGDVLHVASLPRAQVALLLKTIPCLEQIDKEAGRRLLDEIRADHILVSYPVHSLSGRAKGMVAHYETQFRVLTAGRGWSVQRFLFDTELVFLLSR